MIRDKLLEYLTEEDVEFSFSYYPFDESFFTCNNKEFSDFLLNEMLQYVQSSGDAIQGDFIVSKINDEILIKSVGKVKVDWSFGEIDVAINDESIDEIEDFFCKKYNAKSEDLYYNLYVSKREQKYDIKSEISLAENNFVLKNKQFPEEITAKIISKICGPNYTDTNDYEFDLKLNNTGVDSEFIEYFSLSFIL
jgi:hypothetical protein